VNKKILLSGVAAALLMFSGCGSSSSDDSSSVSTSISGIVADGYIEGAAVCIDLNNDGVCNDDEPKGTTDELGRFSINYDGNITGPLVAAGGKDVERNVAFTTVFKAPVKDGVNVTPLVTMAYLYSQENNSTYDAAVSELASSLGIDVLNFQANPEVNNVIKPMTIKVQAAVETMYESMGDTNESVALKLYTDLANSLKSASGNTFDEKLVAAVQNIPDVPDQAKAGVEAIISKIDDMISSGDFSSYVTVKSTVEDAIKSAIESNTTLDASTIETLVDNAISAQENLATNSDINVPSIADIENNLSLLPNTLFDLKNTASSKTADVNAAIDTIAKIRDTIYEFVDPNIDDQENNTSTLVGNVIDNYNNALQPAFDSIGDNLENQNRALNDSLENFGDDLENDFNATFTDIDDRLSAISDVFDAHENNETFDDTNTTYGDTVSHTYTKNSDGTITEEYTINNQTFTVTYPESAKDTISDASMSGNIKLSDDDYTLEVTKISYDSSAKKLELAADATINGENSSEMKGSVSYSVVFDKDTFDEGNYTQGMKDISFLFSGDITTSNGRTLNGSLEFTDSGIKIAGKYTDSSANVILDGNISLNSTNWKPFVDSSSQIIDERDFLDGYFVTINGKLVTKIEKEYYDAPEGNLTTMDGNTYECNISENGDDYVFSCGDGVSVNAQKFEDKVVVFNINGDTYIAEDVWADYDWVDDKDILTLKAELPYGYDLVTSDENGSLYLRDDDNNYTPVTSFSYEIKDPVDAKTLIADFKFSGYAQVGDTKANMELAMDYDGNNTAKAYISNVSFETDKVTFKSDNLLTLTYTVDDEKVKSVEMKEINASVTDDNNNSVTLTNMTVTATDEGEGNATLMTYGKLAYLDFTFEGYVNAKFNTETDYTSAAVYMNVTRNGYEPFTVVGSGAGDENASTTNFIIYKGDYKIGGTVADANDTTTFTLYDTNGIFVNAVFDHETDTDIIELKNKNGDTLAEVNTSVNNWEITYDDDQHTTETLY